MFQSAWQSVRLNGGSEKVLRDTAIDTKRYSELKDAVFFKELTD